jgi:hypothetical protein
MLSHELAKELKDAGFPQGEPEQYTSDGQWIPEAERKYIPTLSELIEACGCKTFDLLKIDNTWYAADGFGSHRDYWATHKAEGSTPEEAVARLWLALNKK